MTTITDKELEMVSGGVPPMLAFYAAYTFLGPIFGLGVAMGATSKQ